MFDLYGWKQLAILGDDRFVGPDLSIQALAVQVRSSPPTWPAAPINKLWYCMKKNIILMTSPAPQPSCRPPLSLLWRSFLMPKYAQIWTTTSNNSKMNSDLGEWAPKLLRPTVLACVFSWIIWGRMARWMSNLSCTNQSVSPQQTGSGACAAVGEFVFECY